MGQRLTIGWLWHDGDPGRTLEEKVARAAQKYREKFGHAPDTCCVNPAAMAEDERLVNGLRVVAVRHVLPHHFFVGVARQGAGAR